VLDETARAFRNQSRAAMTLYTSAGSWGQLLFLVFIGMLLLHWPAVLPPDPAIRTSAILVILFLMSPLEAVMGALPLLGQAGAGLTRLESLGLSLQPGPGEAPQPRSGATRIELRGVTYRYGDEDDERGFVVGPTDLVLRAGELVFLVGGNGSGKTTLGKLVTGLYAPSGGEILLDDKPIGEADRDWYRQHIAAVFVDCHLFEHLIDVSTDERIALARGYLDRLHLSHKVTIRDGKLSTLDLSQGQRKRLALLAAYLEDRSVYLFDEWAADQDPVFKDVFYRELLPELKARGKAVLVITHDDRYFPVADRVVKLDNGQVTEDGCGLPTAAGAGG
jgi:putative ATP-binding cassette transporter